MPRRKSLESPPERTSSMVICQRFLLLPWIDELDPVNRSSMIKAVHRAGGIECYSQSSVEVSFLVERRAVQTRIKSPANQNRSQAQRKPHRLPGQEITGEQWKPKDQTGHNLTPLEL